MEGDKQEVEGSRESSLRVKVKPLFAIELTSSKSGDQDGKKIKEGGFTPPLSPQVEGVVYLHRSAE